MRNVLENENYRVILESIEWDDKSELKGGNKMKKSKNRSNISYKIERFLDKRLGGHIKIGKNLTIFGHNAMHWGVTFWTKKYGYICFRLPLPCYGWKPLYLYCSPNATPWAATFMLGGGKGRRDDWALARLRKARLGHNFKVHSSDIEEEDTNYATLRKINNMI